MKILKISYEREKKHMETQGSKEAGIWNRKSDLSENGTSQAVKTA